MIDGKARAPGAGGQQRPGHRSADACASGQEHHGSSAEQRSLSSFGARTLPRGRATVDLDIGYPYFVTGRISVGFGKLSGSPLGFDATVDVRTMLARQEIGLGGRMMFVDNNPFSAAAFTNLWLGGKLLDDSKRNGVTWDVGGLASLTALTHVTITGRAYFELWSDRHCPAIDMSTDNHFEGIDPRLAPGLARGEIEAGSLAQSVTSFKLGFGGKVVLSPGTVGPVTASP